MHDYTVHLGRQIFCCYSLQSFKTEDMLKCHINECFNINGKQNFKMLKKVSMLHSKIIRGKKSHHFWSMHILKAF